MTRTNKNHTLSESENIMNKTELEKNLKTDYLGKPLIYTDCVDSTNNEIKRLAQKGYPTGTTVIAEKQTSGKGRLGRVWNSPVGTGLWFSFLLRPHTDFSQISGITLAAGLGVCRAVRSFTGLDAEIKWPNDIIIGNKKICGILVETAAETDKLKYAVVGIGINVNTRVFPDEIKEKATSLIIENKYSAINRTKLFKEILFHTEKCIDDYLKNPVIPNDYKQLCATLGRNISVRRGKNVINGIASDISESGDLIATDENHNKILINSGEVTVQGIY